MGLLDGLFGFGNTKRINLEEAHNNINNKKDIIVLDVREDYEYKSGHLKKAINLPLGNVNSDIIKVAKDKDKPIYVYCHSGARSASACNSLTRLGYTEVYNLGGIMSWPYEIVK